LIILKRFNGWK